MTTDEQGIRDVINRLETSWNAGDSTAFAASFVEDADFIHIFGGQLEGRLAIESSHRHIFETIYKGSHVSYRLLRIRMVRPGLAIVFSQAHLDFLEGGAKRELDTRPTLIVVEQPQGWQIVTFQNTRISELPTHS